jgi:pimeloyl-ACP methyl ester carboxylesterase
MIMGRIAKFGLVVVGLLVVLLFAGVGYQAVQTRSDRAQFPAPGRMIDVGGLKLHLDCRGAGSPVVVLEAGLTSGSTTWSLVHDAIARHTRVCAHDRPGMDWSEPIDRIALADGVAARLQALLEAGGEPGPYVLVGMSAGGVYVRAFQRQFREQVAGMVLVDSSHEQQGTRLPQFDGAADMARLLRLCAWLQPIGVVRLVGAMETVVVQYPEQWRGLARANANQSHACRSVLAEVDSFAAQLANGVPPRPLGDLPLIVLTQGAEPRGDAVFGLSDAQARELRGAWDELQHELTALSSRGRQIVAADSGHLIQRDQPQLVIDAVVAMVNEVRGSP